MTLDILLQFFPEPVRLLVLAPKVSDVMINADGRVYADVNGNVDLCFKVEPLNLIGIQNIARQLGDDIDEQNPILDSRLPDGSRVGAVLSGRELTVTIRKFNRWFRLPELIGYGTLPHGVAVQLSDAVIESENILVSGGTSSGKSTLAKALLDEAPESDRLIVIENPRELEISQPNAVRWEARKAVPGRPAVTVAQLVVAALRHRPDRIVIGEVREPDTAYELLQAMNTGHRGTLSTIHADSALDGLYRLSDLALAAHSNLSAEFVRAQVARTIKYVVHVERGGDGRRRVTELVRLLRFDAARERMRTGLNQVREQGEFLIEELYTLMEKKEPNHAIYRTPGPDAER